ncbi:flagellar motor protein MotB [Pseudomonas putida]|uniref:Flagellar motor protein MotB n=1 Tax=Pseudomonas putida TaxID=303 RepID=A0A2Z4RBU0_PSEPU|nr:OmpA family protein [Pseudomonas putida]AWY38571.1 flagellar motor protein MotB [Pseudomonas putida]
MTDLIEMRIRVGGDPRNFSEFSALREELGKLNHPACPDVDWGKVEQLCLTLFQLNGADLQSAAAFALARSQRHGLEGMAQGAALIDALGCQWSNVWPPMASLRLEILSWLFAQWQSFLRGLPMNAWSLPALEHLDTELLRLQLRLDHSMQIPLASLRQQIESLTRRLQQNGALVAPIHLLPRAPEPARLPPIVIWPAPPLPEIKRPRRRFFLWLSAISATIVFVGGGWLSGFGSDDKGGRRFTQLFEQQPMTPMPVRLDSLALFDAGSADLKPDSTKVLINALVNIKAQPGWLIVISGHSDDRGNPEQNRQLSHARASAVRGWMQGMGDIPDSCFAVQGLADSQPITTNDSASGRAANRRVDISLVPQVGACEQLAGGRP